MLADGSKDVVSWPRKLVVSRRGQSSREVPAHPGQIAGVAPSRQMSIWKVRVRTRNRCLLPEWSREDFSTDFSKADGNLEREKEVEDTMSDL